MTPQLLDVVALEHDLPASGLLRGELGAVVETYGSDSLAVEFVTEAGTTRALVTLHPSDVRVVDSESLGRTAAAPFWTQLWTTFDLPELSDWQKMSVLDMTSVASSQTQRKALRIINHPLNGIGQRCRLWVRWTGKEHGSSAVQELVIECALNSPELPMIRDIVRSWVRHSRVNVVTRPIETTRYTDAVTAVAASPRLTTAAA